MPFRTWAKLLGTTFGVAALAGASQLGLAYGLGILRFARVLDVTMRDQWTAMLAWVAWYAMTAAVIGAMAGRPRLPRRPGAGTRILTATAAGLGGAAVVPLTMQPARTAQIAGVHPVFVIGVCAMLGALVGAFGAYAALSRRVARWSFTTVGAAIWVIAIASVVPSLGPSDPLPAVRLGVFDASFLSDSLIRRTALLTMPALSLISGAVLGWAARRRGLSTLTIALSGLAGPALLTLAYLIAGPGSGADHYEAVPYWAAMTAAGAGVLGSVLAAVLRRGPASDGRTPGRSGTGPGVAGEPTPDRPPLPKRDAQPESAIAQAATATATVPAPAPAAKPEATPKANEQAPSFDVFAPVQTRNRAEPQRISAPLPDPAPVAPPPRVKGRKQQTDGDFVDWVSGLGDRGQTR